MRIAPGSRPIPRRSRAIVAVLATVIWISGCGSGPRDTEFVEAYQLELASLIVEAEELGASDEQLQFLQLLQAEKRAPNFEEYSSAVHATLACARDAGVGIDGPKPSKSRNQPTLRWGVGGAMTDEENERLLELHDTCHRYHSYFVEIAYWAQPAGMEWEAALIEQYKPAVIDCLRSYGIAIDDDASRSDVDTAISNLLDSEPNYEGSDCIVESGLGEAMNDGFR